MFSWIPIYQEIAEKLKEYEKKQPELIKILVSIHDSGLPMIGLEDEDTKGKRFQLEEIDPFTFFATFNRGIKDNNRNDIISHIKKAWSLNSKIPSDFSGIPVANNMKSWFFGYKKDRGDEDIPTLWKLFHEAINNEIKENTFNKTLGIYGVSKNITMGLFWLKPDKYLNIDRVNVQYFNKHGINSDFADYKSYLNVLNSVQDKIKKEFYEISFDAWQAFQQTREKEKGVEEGDVIQGDITDVRFWMYAPGPGARFWDECKENNYMVLGWDYLGDLNKYKSRDEITAAMQKQKDSDKSFKNNSLACWEFSNELKQGDIVIAKKGSDTYIGYGVVNDLYRFDETRPEYKNIVPVNWIKSEEVKETQGPIVQKTLTDITKYPDYVARLVELFGIGYDVEKAIDRELEDLPLNVILYGPPGTGKTFKILNEYIPKYFTTRKKSQTKEEYLNSSIENMNWFQVIALAMLDYDKVKVPELEKHEYLKIKTQLSSNNNIRATIWSWLQMHTLPECTNVQYKRRYEPAVFWKHDNSLWEVKRKLLEELTPDIIEIHNNLKNYSATETDEKRYDFVTFHQSYSYEDFVEGIKPAIADDASSGDIYYTLEDGIFKHLSAKAEMNPGKKYALFIDEINRGNIAGIFGELITLIEKDKRDQVKVVLPHSKQQFSVPKNLYMIGTMNTADRSIEALDTALRRRFSFVECFPDSSLLNQTEIPTVGIDLEAMLDKINQRIEVLLDKDHAIGHSYFMDIKDKSNPLPELKVIFSNKIIPLLEEYFYNDRAKIKMTLGPAFIIEKDVPEDLFFQIESRDGSYSNHAPSTYSIVIPDTLEGFRSIYE